MRVAPRHRPGFAIISWIAVAIACAPDAAVAPTARPTPRPGWTVSPGPGETDEQTRLAGFARSLALALRDDAARLHLKNDLDGSHFREHKLLATRYLNAEAGGALRARLAAAAPGGDIEVDATLNSIRSIELYMPVPEHKIRWTGNRDLIVAAQLRQGAPIAGFRLDGTAVALSADSAPTTPTLVLVSTETDFEHPMTDAQVQAADAQLRARVRSPSAVDRAASTQAAPRVSAMVVPCDGCGGGGDVLPPSSPTGMYMEFSRLVDLGEPWTRGDPEIEVHIHGPTDAANSQFGEDLACAGEYGGAYRAFDQNSGFWSGSVLLYTQAQAEAFNSKFHEGFNVLFWEDDDTACTIKTDKNMLRGALGATRDAFGTVAVALTPANAWYIVAGSFFGALYNSADWLLTNDDYLGAAVENARAGQAYTDATHTILRGTEITGRTRLVWK